MENKSTNQSGKLVIFQSKKIRRTWHEDAWYYSVVDIVEALTDSPAPRQYWGKIKQREFVEIELSPIWVQLKLPSKDGKSYKTDCVNTKGAFRLIQSRFSVASSLRYINAGILPRLVPFSLSRIN